MPKAVSLFFIRYDTQFAARNVRYWTKADIGGFWPAIGCPLLTQSEHAPLRTQFAREDVITHGQVTQNC